MDGVMQAPGGPEEDTSGGFKYGGWQAKVFDDSLLGEVINEFLKPPLAMLLGHTTYNVFAGYWPLPLRAELGRQPRRNRTRTTR
jgi:hypothetical protein